LNLTELKLSSITVRKYTDNLVNIIICVWDLTKASQLERSASAVVCLTDKHDSGPYFLFTKC
jgi:hypothetical protein